MSEMCGMKNDCIIQTKRLLLREIREQDAKLIVKWRSDPDIYRYFKNPHTLTLEEHLYWYQNQYRNNTDIVSWIANYMDQAYGLFSVKKENHLTVEISYLLDPKGQGQGFASEALQAVEEWAEKQWEIKCVVAQIHKANEKSIRFIKRNGYHLFNCNGSFCLFNKIVNGG